MGYTSASWIIKTGCMEQKLGEVYRFSEGFLLLNFLILATSVGQLVQTILIQYIRVSLIQQIYGSIWLRGPHKIALQAACGLRTVGWKVPPHSLIHMTSNLQYTHYIKIIFLIILWNSLRNLCKTINFSYYSINLLISLKVCKEMILG